MDKEAGKEVELLNTLCETLAGPCERQSFGEFR
jgi:hypothetical protein